jgi:hypothetical protein
MTAPVAVTAQRQAALLPDYQVAFAATAALSPPLKKTGYSKAHSTYIQFPIFAAATKIQKSRTTSINH